MRYETWEVTQLAIYKKQNPIITIALAIPITHHASRFICVTLHQGWRDWHHASYFRPLGSFATSSVWLCIFWVLSYIIPVWVPLALVCILGFLNLSITYNKSAFFMPRVNLWFNFFPLICSLTNSLNNSNNIQY